ncbi:hypothetical protein P4E94_09950 [Pontiellaceae bacterium B12219]|nr:hypothetical protein [Pontiellaceae bacterium B12219]
MKYQKTFVLGLLVLAGSGAEGADVINWDGGGAEPDFSIGANWEGDAVPTSADTIMISGAYTVNVTSEVECDRLSVEKGAVLNISYGRLGSTVSGNTRTDSIGRNSVGTVYQSGGEYNVGHRMHVGCGNGGNGNYSISGGQLVISRGGRSVLVHDESASLEVGEGSSTGLFKVFGGSVVTRSGVVIGPKGTFSVQGSVAETIGIGSDKSVDGHWIQQTGGTLQVAIDETARGVSKILIDYVDGTGSNGDVIFEEGALLDVSFLGEKKRGVYVVMEWEGTVTDKGLQFAPGVNTNEWDFEIDEVNKRLIVATRESPIGLIL